MEVEKKMPKKKESFRYEDGKAAVSASMRSFKAEGIKKAYAFVEPLEKPTKEKPRFQKPAWATVPSISNSDEKGSGRRVLFDVFKERQFQGGMNLEKGAVYRFGKHPKMNDRVMEHPSISGQHAMLMNTEEQTFLADLGSTHGTKIGKRRVPSRQPIPLYPGTIIRFGASSRMYIYRSFIAETHLRQMHDTGVLPISRLLKETKEDGKTEEGKAWNQMLTFLAFNTALNSRLSYQKKAGEENTDGAKAKTGDTVRRSVMFSSDEPFEIPSYDEVGPAPVMPTSNANSKGMFANIVTSTVIKRSNTSDSLPEDQPAKKVQKLTVKKEQIQETRDLGEALGASVKTTTVVRKKASPAIIAAMKRKAAADAHRKRQGQLLMAKTSRVVANNGHIVIKSKDEEAREKEEDSALEAAEAALNVKPDVVMEPITVKTVPQPVPDGLDLRKR